MELLNPTSRFGWIDPSGAEHHAEGRRIVSEWDGGFEITVAGGPADCRLECRTDPATGDTVVQVRVLAASQDLAGCFVELVVPARMEVQLPALNGLRFGPDHDLVPEFHFPWPTFWNAAMVLAGEDEAGLMVHCEDPDDRPKGLHLVRGEATTSLIVRSEEEAPFTGRRTTDGLEVRVSPWRGPAWQDDAIARYQAWMTRRRGAPNPPAWVREDLRLYASHTDHDLAVMDALAATTPRGGTMVHLGNWRQHLYDCMYPDYTPKPDLADMVRHMQANGLKAMPHTNSWGIDETSDLMAQFEELRVRDAWTGEPLGWSGYPMPDGSVIGRIAYIHPGSQRWRDEQVARLKALVRVVPFDGLYLDQTFHGTNHVHGKVDGLNVAQGMAALLEEVKEFCPILAGEGVNEVIVAHQAIAEVSFLGFFPGMGWQLPEDKVELMMCDINARLFGPWTIGAGHVPWAGEHGGGPALMRCYERLGLLPSLPHASVADLYDPSPETAKVLAAAARGERLGSTVVSR